MKIKLKYTFTIMDMGDEFAAVPVGEDAAKFHGMLKMDALAADVLKQLEQPTDPMTVHRYLKEKYPDETDDEIGKTLVDFLNRLGREGLLERV